MRNIEKHKQWCHEYYIRVTKPKRQLHRKRLYKYKNTEEDRRRYQHEYYMNITKPKRLAKRLAKG